MLDDFLTADIYNIYATQARFVKIKVLNLVEFIRGVFQNSCDAPILSSLKCSFKVTFRGRIQHLLRLVLDLGISAFDS